ncbi:MAG: hypothetical protein JOY64_13980 [Alphaproteobacteria bacterium]|nr:hypothetical protein [Alphaproteobacteria bacterium]MBV8408740.1 hypothetical protein [Alphaproteobacteria bacterium]
MKSFVKKPASSLQRTLALGLRRFIPSVEVAVALAIVVTLATSLLYLASLMSPELALLWDH